MTDREKVIEGLVCCIDDSRTSCSGCYQQGPGFGIECRKGLMHDALVLLKDQEPVMWSYDEDYRSIICSNCGLNVNDEVHLMFDKPISFCPACGRKVKWYER